MGYFNINIFLYNIKKILKYILILLCFLLCISFCFFITSSRVSAETLEDTAHSSNFYIDDTFYSFIQNSDYYNDSYDYFAWAFTYSNTIRWSVIFVPANTYSYIADFNTSTHRFTWNSQITHFYASTDNNANLFPTISNIIEYPSYDLNTGWFGQSSVQNVRTGNVNALYCFFCFGSSNGVILNSNTNNRVNFPTLPASFVPPSFVNYDDSNWGNTLVNGEFNYFYIDGNSVNSVYLYFYDTTYGVGDDDSVVWSAILDENSQYVLHDSNGGIYWAINKTIPFGGYNNNRDYKLVLQYFDNNSVSRLIDYTWTTDFSQSVINGEWDNGLADINKGIDNINNYLNDKSYDTNSVTNNMPNSDEYSDPANAGLLSIFNAMRTAFTTSSSEPVRFYIPFTDNKYIDIPANLTTSHVPQAITFIIQSVYWYIICRYIVKDVSNTANKTKSGELLDSKDGNIRTELL